MFDYFEKAIENVLDVGEGLLEGEMPTKKQVASLVSAGLSAYAISEITGIAEDVIENLIE
jgi:hypothetical protein